MKDVKLISQSNQINDFSIVGRNENWKLIYVYNGEINITLNNEIYNLQPNNIIFISPDDFYYVKENTALLIVLTFKNHFDLREKVLELEHYENELLKSLLESDDENQRETMLQLLLVLCEKYSSNIEPKSYKNKKIRLYQKAVSLMERYLTSSFTVNELAEMLNISLSMLKRIFAEFTGIGVHEYFLILKIKKAKELLISGNSITHIAKVLQFSSQAYFSATFKRVTSINAKGYSMGKYEIKERVKAKQKSVNSRTSDLPDYLL